MCVFVAGTGVCRCVCVCICANMARASVLAMLKYYKHVFFDSHFLPRSVGVFYCRSSLLAVRVVLMLVIRIYATYSCYMHVCTAYHIIICSRNILMMLLRAVACRRLAFCVSFACLGLSQLCLCFVPGMRCARMQSARNKLTLKLKQPDKMYV